MREGVVLLSVCLVLGSVSPALAQERVTVTADLILYGDNTEFRNPFREGETIFGTTARLGAVVDVNPRVRLRLGVLGDRRFGSGDAFDLVRPIVALEIGSARHRFLIGTLPGPRIIDPPGPDRTGPRGLLPPIQRETLAFERPYEAGMLWASDGPRFRHDAWINWQRLNTEDHRERFDAGFAATLRANSWLAVPAQFHIVHEGGQLHAAGPVADSYAAATGLAVSFPAGALGRGSLEGFGVASRHVPDRERPAASRSGAGMFTRLAFERDGWRVHTLFWRGDDFIKDEGDPNYHSIRRSGERYRGVRDYAEAGLARWFRPAEQVAIEVSARAHRVEKHYEYSYRVVSVVGLRFPLRALLPSGGL